MDTMSTASPTYRFVMAVSTPPVKWWGRLEVSGLEHLPTSGPTLLAGNHDSYWDPIAIGLAGLPRRQICALAKSSLWKPGLGKVLDGMGQIPIQRGKGDAHAMDRAIEELRGGVCIGVFPEGTRSLGRTLRARSGFGRLADEVPEAQLVCCTVDGTVDIPKFPKSRPHVKVRFFPPAAGQRQPDESALDLSTRLLAEIRSYAPIRQAGRKQKPIPPMPEDKRAPATPGSSSAEPAAASSPPDARD
jgi:1-acyl-sn-glycerol-3-phosphate acyltransferase